MSFYHLPHPWNPGFVIPDYVMAEPPERGTFTTQMLPRGTISEIVPDFLAKPSEAPQGLGSLGGCTLAGSTLDKPSLSTPTLANDSLGARTYELESLGRSLPRRRSASAEQMGAALGADIGAIASNPYVMLGAAGVVAFFILRKKKKRK